MYNPEKLRELGNEIISLCDNNFSLRISVEEFRLKAAMYKARFYDRSELAETLNKQILENLQNAIGEWDGFSYSSVRADAVYRTLEDIKEQKLITQEDYLFCKV